MSPSAPSPRLLRWPLLALVFGVLAAHAWLLAAPWLPGAEAPATAAVAPRALQTRTVNLPAPVTPAAAALKSPLAAAVPKSRPRPSAAPPSLSPLAPPALPPEEPAATPTVQDPAPHVALPDLPDTPAVEPDVTLASAADQVSAASPPPSEAQPVPFEPPASTLLRYEVKVEFRGIPQTLNGSLDWQHTGDRYRAHMVIDAGFLGSRTQTSEGRIGRNGLHPRRFAEKTRSERAAHFDEDGQRIRYSANSPDAPLLPGHQDRLSVFMQLAGLVHARPGSYPAGHTVNIPTSGVRDSETWAFVVKGTENTRLNGSEVPALHLQRLPRKEFDSRVDVWLAPSLGHVPVRMRIVQANGDVADQRLLAP